MNVKDTIRIFPKKLNFKDGEITIFETSVSRKDEDGNYCDNYSLRVNFPLEIMPAEKRAKFKEEFAYTMEVEGFLTTRSYDDKNGNHKVAVMLYVTKYDLKSKKEIKRKPQPQVEEKQLADDSLLDD